MPQKQMCACTRLLQVACPCAPSLHVEQLSSYSPCAAAGSRLGSVHPLVEPFQSWLLHRHFYCNISGLPCSAWCLASAHHPALVCVRLQRGQVLLEELPVLWAVAAQVTEALKQRICTGPVGQSAVQTDVRPL